MQVPLPFNIISFDITTNQIPGNIRLSYGVRYNVREYFDNLNLTDAENILMILPDFGYTYVRLSMGNTGMKQSFPLLKEHGQQLLLISN